MVTPKCELCREKNASKSKIVNDEQGVRVILTCDECYDNDFPEV